MGVYIKEMNKPKECDECVFDYLQKHPYCDGDISHCPLVEVKTPHGDLIDREEIEVVHYTDADGEHIETYAPTVIEAEVK